MERFALLWDELDDIVGAGAHLATGAALALADTASHLLRRLRSPAVLPAIARRADSELA